MCVCVCVVWLSASGVVVVVVLVWPPPCLLCAHVGLFVGWLVGLRSVSVSVLLAR